MFGDTYTVMLLLVVMFIVQLIVALMIHDLMGSDDDDIG